MTNLEFRNLDRKIQIVENALRKAHDSINADIKKAVIEEDASRLARLAERIYDMHEIMSGLIHFVDVECDYRKMYDDTIAKLYDVLLHRNRRQHSRENNPNLADIYGYRNLVDRRTTCEKETDGLSSL